ncbi:MAG: hypothetical protein MJ007_06960 [Paludibacteraceae bacterium]|nr:hypothetical protein [Paludibacteraceae bacterium]
MKKLLFIGIVVLMVQSLGAVTLPSTSYSSYQSSTPSTGGSFITDAGTMVTGSYATLSAAADFFSECINSTDKSSQERFACCSESTRSCFASCSGDKSCMDECAAESATCGEAEPLGPAPIDGGLGILLVLSVLTGAVSLYKSRRNKLLNK